MARKPEKKLIDPALVPPVQFNLSDSFTSLLLGIVVVVAAIVLFFAFLSGKKQVAKNDLALPPEKIAQELKKATKEETVNTSKSVYTVVAGDTLWSISEKFYNSGFDWQKIAKANSITDPMSLEKGTKLTIPGAHSAQNAQSADNASTRILATSTSVAKEQEQAKIQTQAQTQIAPATHAISGDTYKIIRGDDLWDIAVRAYGDGYKWIDIAKANNLANPDLIHADNILKLPR